MTVPSADVRSRLFVTRVKHGEIFAVNPSTAAFETLFADHVSFR
jgi:hypothetical protein